MDDIEMVVESIVPGATEATRKDIAKLEAYQTAKKALHDMHISILANYGGLPNIKARNI